MANESLVSNPTATYSQFLFADHSGDFGAAPFTAANTLIIGTPTDAQLDLTGLADGGGREAAKIDLGASRPSLYTLDACIEWEAAPTDNAGTINFYWGASGNSTAATGNPAGLTGADAAFTDTVGNLSQLQLIGSLSIRANVVNKGRVGYLMPRLQYGILVVINESGTALRSTATAMRETHITLTPVTYNT